MQELRTLIKHLAENSKGIIHIAKPNTKLQEFFDKIAQGLYMTDMDAATDLFSDEVTDQDGRYRMLKSRLKARVHELILLAAQSKEDAQIVSRSQCLALITRASYLIENKLAEFADKPISKAIKMAEEGCFTDLSILALKERNKIYHESFKVQKLRNEEKEIKRLEDRLQAEHQAHVIFEKSFLRLQKNEHSKKTELLTVDRVIEQLRSLQKGTPSKNICRELNLLTIETLRAKEDYFALASYLAKLEPITLDDQVATGMTFLGVQLLKIKTAIQLRRFVQARSLASTIPGSVIPSDKERLELATYKILVQTRLADFNGALQSISLLLHIPWIANQPKLVVLWSLHREVIRLKTRSKNHQLPKDLPAQVSLLDINNQVIMHLYFRVVKLLWFLREDSAESYFAEAQQIAILSEGVNFNATPELQRFQHFINLIQSVLRFGHSNSFEERLEKKAQKLLSTKFDPFLELELIPYIEILHDIMSLESFRKPQLVFGK